MAEKRNEFNWLFSIGLLLALMLALGIGSYWFYMNYIYQAPVSASPAAVQGLVNRQTPPDVPAPSALGRNIPLEAKTVSGVTASEVSEKTSDPAAEQTADSAVAKTSDLVTEKTADAVAASGSEGKNSEAAAVNGEAAPENIEAASASSEAALLAREQQERKAAFGLDKSLDVVARSDENIVVNDAVVPVAELERQLDLYRGEMSDQNLDPSRDPISAWGAYLVRSGDNLWSIHMRLLREYMSSRGLELPPDADLPLASGQSTGVGKILKFAEHMVGVYNLKTGVMSHNLNLMEPGEKVTVYNLSEIFAQLRAIDLKELSGVSYDGRVLIFPKKADE